MNGKRFKVVGIGEILFDILPDKQKMLGGAPANFAYISNQLGNQGIIAGRIGNDENGKQVFKELAGKNVDVSYLQTDSKHPTGTVEVSLENDQPHYEITENVAWDFLELTEDWQKLAQTCDAVCFGSLAQRNEVSRQTIRNFISLTKPECLRIFDVNLRQNYFSDEILQKSLQIADVCKLNHEELPIAAKRLQIEGNDLLSRAQNLLAKFDLKLICVTLGANGSLLVAQNETSVFPGIETEVENTIGAGDAFTATMIDGLLHNSTLGEINENANKIGSFIASQTGAMPEIPKELLAYDK